MPNLTTEYLDKALTKQSKDLKGYVDNKNSALEHNLKDFVKKEIEELALMTARSFAEQQKQIAALIVTVSELSKTIENLVAMTAREFGRLQEKNGNLNERMDRLEREFAQFKHAMSV